MGAFDSINNFLGFNVGSTLSQFGLNGLSSMINHSSTKSLMRYQNELARENMLLSYRLNSPSSQRIQMMNAGINPLMANGGIQNFQAQAVGMPNASFSSMQAPDLAQTSLLMSQTEAQRIENGYIAQKNQALLDEARSRIDNMNIDTETKRGLKDVLIRYNESLVDVNNKTIEKFDNDIWVAKETIYLQREKVAKEIEKMAQDIASSKEMVNISWFKARFEKALADSQISLNAKQRELIGYQVITEIKKAVNLDITNEGLRLDNKGKELDNQSKVDEASLRGPLLEIARSSTGVEGTPLDLLADFLKNFIINGVPISIK